MAVASGVAPPPDRFNFAAHLLALNRGRGEKVAYVDDERTLTYGTLDLRTRRLAAALPTLGLARGDRVLLVLEDSVEWPELFLAALYAGIVPVAASTVLTADDYAFLLADSGAAAVVTSGALLPTLTAALTGQRLVVARPVAPLPPGVVTLEDLAGSATPATAPAPTGRDDVAFWLYSSGSTGKPKGTLHTHANPYWTAALYGQGVLGVWADDVVFSAAKLFFAYGLGNALSFPLSVGASVVLSAARATPEVVATRLTTHRATIFCGAPTGYAALLAAPCLPRRDAVALRLCSSAGEALPAEIGRRVAAHFGVDVVDGIGSTEMLHIFLSNRPGDVRYGTTGTPVPGYDVELRDDGGHPVADGEIGDLYVRGPSAAIGYWGDRARTQATFQDGWVKSGDKYSIVDGRYVYAGRGDDMIKVSGLYVSPFEVEGVLVQHPDVLEAAVIGVADADGLTKTKAFVVLKPGRGGDAALCADLQAFVKQRLAPYKYPRTVELVAELPKTATGKVQRFRLRERAMGSTACP
jgi:benzoate-CoA ligase